MRVPLCLSAMDLNSSTQETLCRPELVQVREAHFRQLDSLFAGEALRTVFVVNGIMGEGKCDPYAEPERWVHEVLDCLAEQADKCDDSEIFRPLCLQFEPHGIHFMDRLLGAKVNYCAENWWPEPIPTPIGSLQPPDWDRNRTWRLARRIAEAFVASEITVLLFCMPVVAGALTFAVSIYGPPFLETLLRDPSAAVHDLEVINGVSNRIHEWYYKTVPSAQLQPPYADRQCMPHNSVSVYGCTSHLVSAETYRDLAASFDEDISSAAPFGGMIHLCGDHRRHINTWRGMESLRAVELDDRAAEDLEFYFKALRRDQVICLHPTETMTVERALEITGGERLMLCTRAFRDNIVCK